MSPVKVLPTLLPIWTYESVDVSVVEKLRRLLLDFIYFGAIAASRIELSEPFCRAIRALSSNASGICTVMTKASVLLLQYASLLSTGFGLGL